MNGVAGFLQQQCPDLVCLQEVTSSAWDVLKEKLSPQSAEFCSREDGQRKGEASPVLCLSKDWALEETDSFWFSDAPDKPSRAWGAAHPRVCSGLKLRHTNPTMLPLWVLSLHLDHHSKTARANSLVLLEKRVRAKLKSGAEVIVCGDFNMPPYRKAMRDLLSDKEFLQNATHYHPLDSLKPTYLGWSPLHLARARIDHCLHSEGWKTNDYEALMPHFQNQKLSDHRALSVDLSPSDS